MKTVYTCFCTDVIHEGHLNILNVAKKYGKVIVGILSDEAMIRFNRFPTISFEDRMRIVKELDIVDDVVVQDDIMYDNIVAELRPDYIIHGDNWKDEPMKGSRGAFAGGVTEALYDEDNFEQILRKLENFGVIEPKEKK